jgi:tetratricopeptide (TPR) repeat protein
MKKTATRQANASRSTPSSAAKKRAGNQEDHSLLSWCTNHESLCFAVIAAIWVLALYWHALSAPFVYDDIDQIANNPSLLTWHATFVRYFLLPVSFTTNFLGAGGSTYRPIYWLTLALDRQLWGITGASGFHFTNLLFHWANGLILFLLLRRLNLSRITSAAVSIAWLGLPINTEAVAWVSGRAYLLSTLFLLLALLSAHSYINKKKLSTLAYYFFCSLAALFSHEQGLFLLPLTILLLYATDRSNRNARVKDAWTKLTGITLATDILYLIAKHLVGANAGHGASTLWSAGLEFWKYIAWMLAPVHMSVERSTSVPPNTPSITAFIAWTALLALIAAAFFLRKKAPIVAAGIAFGCIALLPFCGFVYIYQGMAERFLYLASIGFTLSLVSCALAHRTSWKGTTIVALLLWMAWGAWRLTTRVLDWNDQVSLYQSSLEATPHSPTLFYSLGYSLLERGDPQGALTAYQKAFQIRPSNDPKTLMDYAVTLERTGNNSLAEQQFKRVIALDPNDSAAYVDLGGLYVQENRSDEAIQCFQQAIKKDPNDSNSFYNLAVLYQLKGRDDLALPLYRDVLRLKPGDPDTLQNMARLHPQPSEN